MIISEGDFKGKFIDELIYDRNIARENKDFELSDKIRNILDEKFVFIFDTKDGQEVYNLSESYFKYKDRFEHTSKMTNRKYVEYKIQEDIASEKRFKAWIYTQRISIKS